MLLNQIWLCGLIEDRHRPKLRLLRDNVPTVDIFVTCAGENSNVILDTIRAAAAIDWPREKFRVVVLDDKDSSDVRWQVQALRYQFPNIYYTARQKKRHIHHHFKAGNLNHGLSFVQGLEGGGAEYIAALDADMIVKPEWLRAILPHLISDPQVGLACPPQVSWHSPEIPNMNVPKLGALGLTGFQLFYNVPKGDSLAQSLVYFFDTFEPIKDRMGVAWCTGSGYAIRRAALHQIGGFPTGSMTEDVFCSSLLLAAGWKTCYVHEPLQYGLIPDSFAGHIRQRTRWVNLPSIHFTLANYRPGLDNRHHPKYRKARLLSSRRGSSKNGIFSTIVRTPIHPQYFPRCRRYGRSAHLSNRFALR